MESAPPPKPVEVLEHLTAYSHTVMQQQATSIAVTGYANQQVFMDALKTHLRDMSEHGWQLVSTTPHTNSTVIVLFWRKP